MPRQIIRAEKTHFSARSFFTALLPRYLLLICFLSVRKKAGGPTLAEPLIACPPCAKGFGRGSVFRPPEHHAGASARVKGAEIDLLNVRFAPPRV